MRREDNIPKRMHDPLFPLKVDGPARKELNLTESMFQAALQESFELHVVFSVVRLSRERVFIKFSKEKCS